MERYVLYRQFSKRKSLVNLPVALVDDFFVIIYQLHSVQLGHFGIYKIESNISHRYYGIPKAKFALFIGQDRVKSIRSDVFSYQDFKSI